MIRRPCDGEVISSREAKSPLRTAPNAGPWVLAATIPGATAVDALWLAEACTLVLARYPS